MVTLVHTSSGVSTATGGAIASNAQTCANGNLLVVMSAINSATATITAHTDTAGDTFTQCTGALKHGATDTVDMWFTKTAGATNNVVTFTWSVLHVGRGIIVHEYSGQDATSPFDTATNGTTSSGTSVTSSSFTPSASTNFCVAMCDCTVAVTTWTADSNYTKQVVVSGGRDMMSEDRLNAGASSQTASASANPTGEYDICVASFKAAAAAFQPDEDFPFTGTMTNNDPVVSVWG